MKPWKILVVVALAGAVVAAVSLKSGREKSAGVASSPATAQGLPRLVDLGSTTCIPCRMMAPILEELKKDYAGRFDVEFINVAENPEAAKRYKIELIPTQVFLGASGQERDRHVGFWSKDDILGHWQKLGFNFSGQPEPLPAISNPPEAKSGST